MHAMIVPVTPLQQNCSVIWCEETMLGAVIDPGGDIERILGAVDEQGNWRRSWSPTGIVIMPAVLRSWPNYSNCRLSDRTKMIGSGSISSRNRGASSGLPDRVRLHPIVGLSKAMR